VKELFKKASVLAYFDAADDGESAVIDVSTAIAAVVAMMRNPDVWNMPNLSLNAI
jgi:hypothetical protein